MEIILYFYENGWYHNDIKPANLAIDFADKENKK